MADERETRSLSKNLLKMKFMKRSEESKIRQQMEEDEKRELDEAHWVLDNIDSEADINTVEYETSFVVCEDLLPTGRMSFRKFNPAIEKLFKQLVSEKELTECEERENENTVSEKEMAKRYDSLIDTVGKKFSGKRKRHGQSYEPSMNMPPKKQKAQFKKPKED